MLDKQLKPQRLPAHTDTPCPWPLWTKLHSKTPVSCISPGPPCGPTICSSASFSLTSHFLNRKMNLFLEGWSWVNPLGTSQYDTEPESMESLKFNWVKSHIHGWVSSTNQVSQTPKMPGHFTFSRGCRSWAFLTLLIIPGRLHVLQQNQILSQSLIE